MSPRHLFSIGLTTIAALSISVEARDLYIGLEIPPMPAGCSHREGMLLGTSFAYDRIVCNGTEIVLLQRFKERRGNLAYWSVIDELHLPTGTSKSTALEVPLCTSKAHPNDTILAIGRWAKAKDGSFIAKNVSRAWRFNLGKGKIEAISTRGVSCEGDDPD